MQPPLLCSNFYAPSQEQGMIDVLWPFCLPYTLTRPSRGSRGMSLIVFDSRPYPSDPSHFCDVNGIAFSGRQTLSQSPV